MELWIKGTAGTTGVCLYPDPMFILNRQTKLKECVTMLPLPPAMHAKSGERCRIWYGRRKELWIKGAAGTGSVDQQAVERHW